MFSQSPEEYANSLDLEMVRAAGSSVRNEVAYFITDKRDFMEILDANSFQKKYAEEIWNEKNYIGKKIDADRFLKLCKKNEESLCRDFGPERLIEHPVTKKFASAVLECLDIREYVPYEKEEGAVELYDTQLEESSDKDISDLIYLADRIVNEFDIDFDDFEKNRTEIEYYKLFSDFMDYPFPDAYRFQSEKCFNEENKGFGDLRKTLDMMGLEPDFLPESSSFDDTRNAVWKLSRSIYENKDREWDKASLKELNKAAANFISREISENGQEKNTAIKTPDEAGKRFTKEIIDFVEKVPLENPRMVVSEVLSKWNDTDRKYLERYFEENKIKTNRDFDNFLKEKCGMQVLPSKNPKVLKTRKDNSIGR